MEQKPRARGRPRAFDADAALERATRMFSERGFSGTSIADLGAELGLSPPSLYAAWQSKESLFCQCLRRYSRTEGAKPIDALCNAQSLASGLAAFFGQLVTELSSAEGPRGCFLVAAMAETSALPLEARRIVDDLREARKAELEGFTARARARGEIRDGIDTKLYAALVASAGLALNIKARAGTPMRELKREARMQEAILLAFAGAGLRLS